MNPPNDSDLLNAMERYGWDVDAPEPNAGGRRKWVVFHPDAPFGDGIGSGRSLRTALSKAYAATLRRKQAIAAPTEVV